MMYEHVKPITLSALDPQAEAVHPYVHGVPRVPERVLPARQPQRRGRRHGQPVQLEHLPQGSLDLY